jgi:hypothetical protein
MKKIKTPIVKPPIEIVAWIPATAFVLVRGQSGKLYLVNHDIQNCTCPDFQCRARHQCKHLLEIMPLVPHRAILEAAQMRLFAAECDKTAEAKLTSHTWN